MEFRNEQWVLAQVICIVGGPPRYLARIVGVDERARTYVLEPYESWLKTYRDVPFETDEYQVQIRLTPLSDEEAARHINDLKEKRLREYRKLLVRKDHLQTRYGFTAKLFPAAERRLPR